MKARRNDIILIAALLLAGGALTLWLSAARQTGGWVSVTVDGVLLMELPLDEDTQVEIGGGGHANTLVIRDGAAQITAADCPDQICVRQGAVRYEGETIVCLPHKLIVTVEGGVSGDVDATAK